jgi:phosphatidylglycerophosphatase A
MRTSDEGPWDSGFSMRTAARSNHCMGVGTKLARSRSHRIFFADWALTTAHLKNPSNDEDPQWIVIDEVAGQWITLAVAPSTPFGMRCPSRFFDCSISSSHGRDRQVSGAFGIMLDDVLAALYAALSLITLQLLWTALVSQSP